MKNILRKAFLLRQLLLTMALTLIVAGGVFAQSVGDTVQVNGQRYRIEQVNGDRLTLLKVGRYEVINQALSWTDAKVAAERAGGHLAVITSAEEQRTIEALVTSNGSMNLYWLGGSCESDRVWKWITGERMSYTNWGPGENNNLGGNENMMSFTRQPFTFGENRMLLGHWVDEVNTRRNGYIIEWD